MQRIHMMVCGIVLCTTASTSAMAQGRGGGLVLGPGKLLMGPGGGAPRKGTYDLVLEQAFEDISHVDSAQNVSFRKFRQEHMKQVQAVQDSLGQSVQSEAGRKRLIEAYKQRFTQLRGLLMPWQQQVFDKNVKKIEEDGYKGPLGIQKG